jgi:hypothetical protein
MPRTPIDYSKALIYKLVCLDPTITEIYVGSTTNFNERYRNHKKACYYPQAKGHNSKVYEYVRNNGGLDNFRMELVEYYPTDDKLKLLKREGELIRELNATLNSEIPGRTTKEYIKDNNLKVNEKTREWRKNNKEIVAEYEKRKYEKHKTKILEKRKEYRETNKIIIAEKKKEKYNCSCGSCICKDSKSTHEKSQKHINYIQSLANVKV